MASSEYLQREEAAKKQLGAKGVKKRVKQLPTAARAFTREMTGIDISRKGVKVDPFAVAMALPVGKVLKAANVLRAVGKAAKAAPLANRLVAKSLGKDAGRLIAQNSGVTNSFIRENVIGNAKKVRNLSAESTFPRAPKKGPMGQPDLGDLGAGRVGLPYSTPAQIRRTNRARQAAQQGERMYELEKRLNLPGKAPSRSNVSEGTLNIVDTRRMNPAQAKSALEGGVNQTAKIKRRVPSAPKKVNKVTKRLLGGR